MKRSLIAVVLTISAFLSATVHAQYAFPLGELQKLTSKNASDFETFVMGKDYTYQSKLSNKELKVFTSDKKTADGKQYIISRYQVPNAMARVTFTTTDKSYYLDTKAKLAANGVKYVNEDTKPIEGMEANCYNYASGALKVSLCSYSTEVYWYRIEVHF